MSNSFYDPKISINKNHLQVVFSVELRKKLWWLELRQQLQPKTTYKSHLPLNHSLFDALCSSGDQCQCEEGLLSEGGL